MQYRDERKAPVSIDDNLLSGCNWTNPRVEWEAGDRSVYEDSRYEQSNTMEPATFIV